MRNWHGRDELRTEDLEVLEAAVKTLINLIDQEMGYMASVVNRVEDLKQDIGKWPLLGNDLLDDEAALQRLTERVVDLQTEVPRAINDAVHAVLKVHTLLDRPPV